jgi:GMP synthase-like glutamine amidotransferase
MRTRPGLILQHDADAPPALLSERLRARGLEFVVHPVWEREPPDPREFAFVAALGSEQSATAGDPAWVPQEIAALRIAVDADVPVLGLCFGGQALSVALGGWSDPLAAPEIGWIEVDSVDPAVPRGPWLQYHRELMRVPPGARELARSPAGTAVFRHGPHLALQFHPEVDAALVDLWARTDPRLAESGLTPADLAAQSAAHAASAREQAFMLFDWWLATAAITTTDGDERRR